MQAIHVLWLIKFFLLALVLVFVWAKLAIISARMRAIEAIVQRTEEIRATPKSEDEQTEGSDGEGTQEAKASADGGQSEKEEKA